MGKYTVELAVTYKREISVYGRTHEDAEDKAVDIVQKWDGIYDVDILSVRAE